MFIAEFCKKVFAPQKSLVLRFAKNSRFNKKMARSAAHTGVPRATIVLLLLLLSFFGAFALAKRRKPNDDLLTNIKKLQDMIEKEQTKYVNRLCCAFY